MESTGKHILLYGVSIVIGVVSRVILWNYPLWCILTVTVLGVTVWWFAWELWIYKGGPNA